MIKLQDAYSISRIKTTIDGQELIPIENGMGMFKNMNAEMHQDSRNSQGIVTLTVPASSSGMMGDIVECSGTRFVITDIWWQEKMMMRTPRYKSYTLQARMPEDTVNINL